MGRISDIKLIRTDTTLDLSQKAEKGMRISGAILRFLYGLSWAGLLQVIDVGIMQ